jgi:hypothetical protein
MLKRIVMQLNGKMECLCTQALGLLKERLCKPVSNLLVKFTLAFQNVISRLRQRVNIALLQNNALAVKMKLVRLLTSASKTALIRLERLWILVGLKYHGNVAQPQQRAKSVRKRVKRLAKTGTMDK